MEKKLLTNHTKKQRKVNFLKLLVIYSVINIIVFITAYIVVLSGGADIFYKIEYIEDFISKLLLIIIVCVLPALLPANIDYKYLNKGLTTKIKRTKLIFIFYLIYSVFIAITILFL